MVDLFLIKYSMENCLRITFVHIFLKNNFVVYANNNKKILAITSGKENTNKGLLKQKNIFSNTNLINYYLVDY